MAYQITRRTAVIEFEEEVLAGAEIRCRLDVPLGVFLGIQEALVSEQIDEAFRRFVDEIVESWDFIDEDGSEIPVNYEGICSLPFRVAVETITAWVNAVNNAPLV